MGGGGGDLKKGPWTREEDQKLIAYIQEHGYGSWRTLPTAAGLKRCGKSCRLRWTNYLRPDIKRGKFSTHEEKTIIRLHALLGNRWSAIAAHLPKRTDNEIKNYWNTRLKKRLTRMGIDPATHKPKPGSTRPSSSLTHMAQWEAARLEAEARLARQSNLFRTTNTNKPPLFRRQPPPPPCLDVLNLWRQSTTIPINLPTCFFRSPATLESPTSTLNFSSNGPTTLVVNTNDAVPAMNEYACGPAADCYTATDDQLQLQEHVDVDVYPSELAGIPVDQLADINPQLVNVEDDNSYWNYLLNLVSSPMNMMDSSTSFL